MPVTLLYGRERAQVARLVLSLLRTVRNAYTPKLVIWNASSLHYKALVGTPKESAYGSCRYERPADRAVGAECAGTIIFGEASSSSAGGPVNV